MPSIEVPDGNNGFVHIAYASGSGTKEDPYVQLMPVNFTPDVTNATGWNNPTTDYLIPSEKLVKVTIDNQEITQATFNTSDGVLTLTKTDGNITVDLDGRYISLGGIDADTITISNIELDNFKTSAIVTQSEGISSNYNDTTIPTTYAVKDYVDNAVITSIDADNVTITNIELDNFKSSAIVTESEGIASNDNDTTIPTSSAVKDYVDNAVIPDTNTFVNGASFNTTTRVLTLSLNNSTSLTVNIPGGSLSNLVEDTTPELGGDLNLNSNNITGTGNISITGDVTASRFNGNLSGQNVIICKSGQSLNLGDPVYISGYDATQAKPIVSLAQSGVYQSPYGIQQMPCVGLASASVTSGSSMLVVTSGELTGIDTSSFNVGDTLYVADYQVSTTLTDTPPTDATSSDYSLIQTVGIVLESATSGTILVQINKPNELPNLDYNEVIIGNSNNQPEKRPLTKADVGLGNVPNLNSADASNISTGTLSNDRLSNDIPKMTNGVLPAVDGSQLTNLPSAASAPDYLYSIKNNGAYTHIHNSQQKILYNNVTSFRGSSISLNVSTGVFTVQKGKTYKITLKSSVFFRSNSSTHIVSIVIDNVTKASTLSESIENNISYIRANGNLTYIADIPAGAGTSEIFVKHPGGFLSTTYTPGDERDYILIEEL